MLDIRKVMRNEAARLKREFKVQSLIDREKNKKMMEELGYNEYTPAEERGWRRLLSKEGHSRDKVDKIVEDRYIDIGLEYQMKQSVAFRWATGPGIARQRVRQARHFE